VSVPFFSISISITDLFSAPPLRFILPFNHYKQRISAGLSVLISQVPLLLDLLPASSQRPLLIARIRLLTHGTLAGCLHLTRRLHLERKSLDCTLYM
jgi:hypothetical protein